MPLKAEWIRYGEDRSAGYFCYPERAETPLPAVLVLSLIHI